MNQEFETLRTELQKLQQKGTKTKNETMTNFATNALVEITKQDVTQKTSYKVILFVLGISTLVAVLAFNWKHAFSDLVLLNLVVYYRELIFD